MNETKKLQKEENSRTIEFLLSVEPELRGVVVHVGIRFIEDLIKLSETEENKKFYKSFLRELHKVRKGTLN
tara:strand:+ start:554 stop:766 length:213 start_codon:yes stop_codon:yes gene_type:complete